MNKILKVFLIAFQLLIGIMLCWQGMNEAYKFDEANYIIAFFSLFTSFSFIFLGILNIIQYDAK